MYNSNCTPKCNTWFDILDIEYWYVIYTEIIDLINLIFK